MTKISMLVLDALKTAIQAHCRQFRKFSGKPYLLHPLKVAEIVKSVKKSKNIDKILAAALLHDTVEDTNVSIEEIEDKFGAMTASLVAELTNNDELKEYYSKRAYLAFKMLYMSDYGLVIKLADRLSNI